MQRLLQQIREYRQNAFNRYDPNGIVDRIREQLDNILQMEREAIDHRRDHRGGHDGTAESGDETPGASPPAGAESSRPGRQSQSGGQSPTGSQPAGGQSPREGSLTGGQSQSPGSGESGSGEFGEMLERMLQRKEAYLQQLPEHNAGRIRGLREYDFLSPEAREAFEQLVGGMQRELMEQYFQGMKQGIGNITPEQLAAMRQMVRDLNDMLEASQDGDREAFDRFMEQYGDYFPPGINSLEELLEHLQRQSAAMQALLDSMDEQQRAELEAMMNELLQDDRLRLDLARLAGNLASMGYAPGGGSFPFRGQEAPGFGESLDMMRRLQAMQDLENAMRGGDPFNAMANAGGHNPADLFGPRLGGQISAVRDMAQSLLDAGYLKREGNRLSLTARAIRKIGDSSLREIFRRLKDDRAGGHATPKKGQGGDITLESRPYQFGDPFHVDIKSTIMNGVGRDGQGVPVQIEPDDFAIYETERAVQHATVLALDMSHSMYLSGLFLEAKKTALALDSLIRGQFPRDALYLIGFANVAFELSSSELPRLCENDYVYGTNYEMALALARKLLARHRGGNRQIMFVTDGEPTACMLDGHVYFDWPPPPLVLSAALTEAARCAREGITINTFLLDPSPRLARFAETFTATNRGRMFFAGPYHLGEQVVLDYLHGRTVRPLH
jgi:uncharacterized protein with von Willebrand factor type A (vWA) domain